MDMREIERAAREQGWEVSLTKKGHKRFKPPDPTKKICIASGTPSDWRSIKNFLADLKRQGFVWPWPPPKGKEKD